MLSWPQLLCLEKCVPFVLSRSLPFWHLWWMFLLSWKLGRCCPWCSGKHSWPFVSTWVDVARVDDVYQCWCIVCWFCLCSQAQWFHFQPVWCFVLRKHSPGTVADMFWGGSLLLAALCCQHFIVNKSLFRRTWCVLNVGGESYIFVGGNMFKANLFNLSSFIFFSFPALYLNLIFTIRVLTLSFVTGCHAVAVIAVATAFLCHTARKPSHVQREFVLAFEHDTQFLACFAGPPSLTLFVVMT